MEKIRKPSVAGRFYPADKEEITEIIYSVREMELDKINRSLASGNHLLGGVSPHAGYVFSAYQAIHLYDILATTHEQFETFVIVNPNHSGLGTTDYNLCGYTAWETPLGKVELDTEMAEALDIVVSDAAHDSEHSGEVQVPFLQLLLKYPFKILPITMNRQNPEAAALLAGKIEIAASKLKRKIFLIASSDFCHYLPPALGAKIDDAVLTHMLHLDTANTYKTVKELKASICGYGPIMTLMEYLKRVAIKPQLTILRRGHSGDVHPSDRVVDYVSMLGYEKTK
ncbi:MAG: AmmeMemoRadiSam system protein B [Bacteroidota bacterium]|nr:AmmeMemoRadiSam system protein B [Bacteroidota bacterium]MDP4206894.1 AmmeMemoRadiSam system protein B [Bacteroidota bacterium]